MYSFTYVYICMYIYVYMINCIFMYDTRMYIHIYVYYTWGWSIKGTHTCCSVGLFSHGFTATSTQPYAHLPVYTYVYTHTYFNYWERDNVVYWKTKRKIKDDLHMCIYWHILQLLYLSSRYTTMRTHTHMHACMQMHIRS